MTERAIVGSDVQVVQIYLSLLLNETNGPEVYLCAILVVLSLS